MRQPVQVTGAGITGAGITGTGITGTGITGAGITGAGSVMLPPVIGTLTCIGAEGPNMVVENVELIVVGALINAPYGAGAVPFVMPVNTKVVGTKPGSDPLINNG